MQKTVQNLKVRACDNGTAMLVVGARRGGIKEGKELDHLG